MTDVLIKPAFQSGYVDSGDTTKFGPTAWNAARLFSGGALGDLLVRDTGAATGASYLPDVAKGSLLISAGVGVVPAWSPVGATGQSLIRDSGQASGFLWAERSRVLTVNTTQVGTDANTNEKDLWSYAMPGGTLNADGRAVRLIAYGTVATNGNAKTIRLYFGASVLQIYSAGTASNQSWLFTALVTRTGAAAQLGIGEFLIGSIHTSLILSTPAETLSGSVTIKVTGQNGTGSANDIVSRGSMVELLN